MCAAYNKFYHKTKYGKQLSLKKMSVDHLVNTINYIHRKAKEGLLIKANKRQPEDKTYYGEEVYSILNYAQYMNEIERRVDTGEIELTPITKPE